MESAPTPLDVQEFQFKLHCKLKVFDKINNNTNNQNPSLVCTASQIGLIFIGCHCQLQVIQLNSIINTDTKNEILNYPRRNINFYFPITHVAVNCDNSLLAVVVNKDNCPTAIIYQVTSFLSQNLIITNEIRLSPTPNVFVRDLCWNPGVTNILAVCLSDGSAAVFELKQNGVQLNTLPSTSQSKCLCWSPKGKQIVIGAENGSITQYKPDLKSVKTFTAPPVNNSNNVTIFNILWISNYQFIGIYKDMQDSRSFPTLIVVNTPKNGPISYVNFEDICYSSGDSRPIQFYLIYQQIWNVIIAASANSMEVGVLGILEGSGGTAWRQWIQSDNARAELPLSATKEETFPVGLALDTGSTHQLPWGENQTLPPMPTLHILSNHGVLNVFNVINLRTDAPNICAPPQNISDQSGLHLFTSDYSLQNKDSSFSPQITTQTDSFNLTKVNFQNTNTDNKVPLPFIATSTPIIKSTEQSTLPFGAKLQFLEKNVISNTQDTTQESTIKFANINPIQKDPAKEETLEQLKENSTQKIQFTQNTSTLLSNNTTLVSTNLSESKNETQQQNSLKDEEENNLIISLISNEIKNFESEINSLLTRCKGLRIDVGTDNEKTELVQKCYYLENFFKELVDITEQQTCEVHALKQILIEAFALQEEANSRFKRLSDPHFVHLFKIHDIDPISNKKIAEIKRSLYYVESQLKQINQCLDNEWNEFENFYKKNSKDVFHTPILEAIYQSMVKQSEIIRRQSFILKDIKARIKSRINKEEKLPLLTNLNITERENASQIVSNTFIENIKNLHLKEPNDNILLAKYKFIEEKQQKFSKEKEEKLRTLLQTNKVTRITPIKPNKSKLSSSILPTKIESKILDNIKKTEIPSIKIVSMPIAETTPVAITKIIKDELKTKPEIVKVSKKLFECYEDITPPTTPLKVQDENANPLTSLNSIVQGINEKSVTNMVTSFKTPVSEKSVSFVTEKSQLDPFKTLENSSALASGNIFATQSQQKPTATTIPNLFSNNSATSIFTNKSNQPTSNMFQLKTTTSNSTFPSNSSLSFPASTTNSVFKIPSVTSSGTFQFSSLQLDNKFKVSAPVTTSVSSSSATNLPIFNIPKVPSSLGMDTKGVLNITSESQSQTQKIPETNSSMQSANVTNNKTAILETKTDAPKISTAVPTTTLTSSTPFSFLTAETKPFFSFPSTNVTNTTSNTFSFTNQNITTSSTSSIFGNIVNATSLSGNTSIFSGILPITTAASVTPFNKVTATTTSQSISSKSETTTTSFELSNTSLQSPTFKAITPSTTSSVTSSTVSPSLPTEDENTNNTSKTLETAQCQPSPFGKTESVTTQSQISFANVVTTSPSVTSSFGTVVTTTVATTSSIFGTTASTTPTTTVSPFGSTVSTVSSTTTTTLSPFGKPATTVATPQSSFSTTSNTTTTTIQSSPFATSVTSTSTSPFTTNTGSLFDTAQTATGTNTFGFVTTPENKTTSASSTFNFGNLAVSALSSQATSTNATSTTGASTFSFVNSANTGTQQPSNTGFNFGQNIFSQPSTATTTASQNTFMGAQICSPSVFGQNNQQGSIFPNQTQNSTNVFAQNTNKESIFAQKPPPFGNSTSTNVSQSTTTPGSIFSKPSTGSAFGQQSTNIFGAKPAFGQAPAFGQPPAFGNSSTNIFSSNTNNTSTFGSNTSRNLFNSPQQPNAFGSPNQNQPITGSFSGGNQTVNQTGFGSPPAFQKPPGTAFGSPPSFGSSSFGGPPTFGGSPTFGSPQKVFGSSVTQNAPTFGSVQQNTTFANLATQNTVGFGNLAQSAGSIPQNPTQPQFSGGNAFTSWR